MTLRHRPHRVLYVPLDSRPCNAKAPRLLAQMVDYEFLMPPAETLGQFREPGQPEAITRWLRARAEPGPDCIILSLDMLAYGGLWGSRSAGTRTKLAQERLNVLADLRAACPEVPIYAFSALLRLGTLTSADEAGVHLDSLFHHSVLSGRVAEKPNPEDRACLTALERSIPPGVLGEYLAVRGRNREVNARAVEEVERGNLDFLVLGQDTAGEDGVHRQEQAALARRAEELGVDDRVVILPGVDQVGMCLLARFIHAHMDKVPVVRVVTAEDPEGDRVPPGEDRPFAVSLAAHLRLVGAREAEPGESDVDLVLPVNWPAPYSRKALRDPEIAAAHREAARRFVTQAAATAGGRGLAVCDAGFSDGADDIFVEELIAATPELPSLLTYAGWSSASNSVGSALAHGTLRLISLQDKGAFDLAQLVGDISPMRYLELLDSLISSEKAHIRFLVSRFADDWLYQARVRPRVLEHICQGLESGLFDLSRSYQQAEGLARDELVKAVTDLWIDQFLGKQCALIGLDPVGEGEAEEDSSFQSALALAELEETRVSLPWRRLLEVDLEVEFGMQLVART